MFDLVLGFVFAFCVYFSGFEKRTLCLSQGLRKGVFVPGFEKDFWHFQIEEKLRIGMRSWFIRQSRFTECSRLVIVIYRELCSQ